MASQNDVLSERELEILRLVAEGATNQQIARELFISVNTVKVHLKNIFAKLGAESRTEAATAAIRQGLIRVRTPVSDAEAAAPRIVWPEPVRKATRFQRIYLVLAAVLALALILFPSLNKQSQSSAEATVFLDRSASALMASQRASSRWTTRAALPTPRGRLAVVAYGEGVFAIGGVHSGQVSGAVEEYLPDTDQWVIHPAKPTPVANIGAVAVADKIYVPGGYDASGRVLSALEIYDPATDTWEQGASLPSPRCAYALAEVDGKVYLFGGWDGKRYLADALRYDPTEDRWIELSPMPMALGFQAAAAVDGKLYVIGGYDGAREYAVAYEYDPALDGTPDAWTERSPMSLARGGAAATAVGASIYVIGGGWESFLAYNERYEPRSDTWVRFETPLTGQWRNLGVAPWGRKLYALGGWSGEDLDFNGEYQAIYTIVVPHTVR